MITALECLQTVRSKTCLQPSAAHLNVLLSSHWLIPCTKNSGSTNEKRIRCQFDGIIEVPDDLVINYIAHHRKTSLYSESSHFLVPSCGRMATFGWDKLKYSSIPQYALNYMWHIPLHLYLPHGLHFFWQNLTILVPLFYKIWTILPLYRYSLMCQEFLWLMLKSSTSSGPKANLHLLAGASVALAWIRPHVTYICFKRGLNVGHTDDN